MNSMKWGIACVLGLLLLQGCGSAPSVKNINDISIKASSGDDTSGTLGTLAVQGEDAKKILMDRAWTGITANVSAFYENSTLPTNTKSYKIDIAFTAHQVVAYADCQKLTANYKITDTQINFSKSTIAPAIDLPSCLESEYADEAVLALFSNSFDIEAAKDKIIVFNAVDFDTKVSLNR